MLHPCAFFLYNKHGETIEHTSDENGGMNNEADDDRNLEDGI